MRKLNTRNVWLIIFLFSNVANSYLYKSGLQMVKFIFIRGIGALRKSSMPILAWRDLSNIKINTFLKSWIFVILVCVALNLGWLFWILSIQWVR